MLKYSDLLFYVMFDYVLKEFDFEKVGVEQHGMQCVTAKWWINISILKRCVALDTLESKQLVMFKTLEVSTPCAA